MIITISDIDQDTTIKQIKEKFEDKNGIPYEMLQLIYKGKYLLNRVRIGEYRIPLGSDWHFRLFRPETKLYEPLKTRTAVELHEFLNEDITQIVICFLDIRELVAFSLITKSAYDLVNSNTNLWKNLAIKNDVGIDKNDCLLLLDYIMEPVRDSIYRNNVLAADREEASQVLEQALSRSDTDVLLCQLQAGQFRKITLGLRYTMIDQLLQLPLPDDNSLSSNWTSHFIINFYDTNTKELVSQIDPKTWNLSDRNRDGLVLKGSPYLSLYEHVYIPYFEQSVTAVAYSKPFESDFVMNESDNRYTGGRIISNAVVCDESIPHPIYNGPQEIFLFK
jgi:hypothetical protein